MIIFLLALLPFSLFAFDQEVSHRILYQLQRGMTEQGLNLYLDHYKGNHDSEMIQAIATAILNEGFRSNDPEKQLLSIFGAGISLNEKLMGVLELGLNSASPETQLASLNFLARFQNDIADRAIHHAMASDFVLIRLEAALHLAQKKDPKVVDQTEALLNKLPKQIHALFPQLFALIGTADAMKILRKMLASSSDEVRVEAIRSIAKYGRDDFIGKIRMQAAQHNPAVQEVCAYALGVMRDEYSVPQLERLAAGNTPAIRLAALKALYQLGRKEAGKEIEKMAKGENLFAIQLLGHIPGCEETLVELMRTPHLQLKYNAAIALLHLQDARCLPLIAELLLRDARDLGLAEHHSLAGTLKAIRVIPSSSENFKEDEASRELSLHLKEQLLVQAVALAENDFLQLAAVIFETNHTPLVPTLVHLLEELQTARTIELLKFYQQKAGAPLIRNYCNLALYRLQEPGPYLEQLKKWVAEEQRTELIRFRSLVAKQSQEVTATYQLTPQETSLLLVEAYEAIAKMQDKESLDILISAIKNGNQKNKYALAGLLIRAAQ